jgi:TrmH family RNA methyltransferase
MITVVLHEPQDLVNIAHVLRGMKNFGLRDLRLVHPREYDAFRIGGIAHKTDDLLERVRLYDSLDQALADCVHVIGFTARGRTAKRNWRRPADAATEALELAEQGTVALVFGREDKGLPNEALDRCHRIVAIPTNPDYPSLNLGHAVIIMLYALAVARGDDERPFKTPRRRAAPARQEELERVFADLERALAAIDFFKHRERDAILRTVREALHRIPLDEREAKLVQAMAHEVIHYAERLARSGLHVDGE